MTHRRFAFLISVSITNVFHQTQGDVHFHWRMYLYDVVCIDFLSVFEGAPPDEPPDERLCGSKFRVYVKPS